MEAKDYSLRCNFSYAVGIYLAVNAIPDAYLLIDGPSCAFHKAELIQGNHDLLSTLLDSLGNHRLCNTDANTLNIAAGRVPIIAERLTALKHHPGSGVVLVAALPMASIVGTQYESIIASLDDGGGAPIFVVPPDPFDGDWLEGYASVLKILAESISLDGGKPDPGNVAVVGYFMDRVEADHTGNLRELRGLLRELGLNPVSVWLGNGSYSRDLGRIRDAGTIISLPHGREAARILAGRLRAELIETDIPFGLSATQRWVRKIAEACDRRKEAETLIDRHLSAVIPRLEWVVPRFLLHRRFAYIGDPFLYTGLGEMSHDFGFEICCAVLACKKSHVQQVPASSSPGPGALIEPGVDTAYDRLLGIHKSKPVDLVITNCFHLAIVRSGDLPFLEFGFPNYLAHRLHDAPFLGFTGCLRFLEDISNRLTLFETLSREQLIRPSGRDKKRSSTRMGEGRRKK